MARGIILCGHAGIGKRFLVISALRQFPDIAGNFKKIPIYNSREKLPKEQEGASWYFRSEGELNRLSTQRGMVSFQMREGNFQALDLCEFADAAKEPETIAFVRILVSVGVSLPERPELKGIDIRSIFVSPISIKDILYLKAEAANDPEKVKAGIIKLLRKKLQDKKHILRRISADRDINWYMNTGVYTIFDEMLLAPFFKYVLVHPDTIGEGPWSGNQMTESAEKPFLSFVDILRGREPEHAEKWPDDMFMSKSRIDQLKRNFRPGGSNRLCI
jgi:guanylate kinase